MPQTPLPAAPVALGPAPSARLDEALRSVLYEGEGAGELLLQGALADPSVHTVILALKVRGPREAHVVQVLRVPDRLAQWEGLACI